jgi:hypothetical protein
MTISDTHQDAVKPSSYLPTENLETQERVINLGKKLVSNFKQNDPDEVTIWMINYLAEQIEIAENSSCEIQKKKCFETILQLWESRCFFPDGTRPFEQLEPILKALNSLSPENTNLRYFNNQEFGPSEELDGPLNWLDAAKRLDATARTLITFMFEQAMDHAQNENTKDWIKTLSGTMQTNEIEFIVRFSSEKLPNKIEQRIAKLDKRVNYLKAFEDLSQSIREQLEAELNTLKQSK